MDLFRPKGAGQPRHVDRLMTTRRMVKSLTPHVIHVSVD